MSASYVVMLLVVATGLLFRLLAATGGRPRHGPAACLCIHAAIIPQLRGGFLAEAADARPRPANGARGFVLLDLLYGPVLGRDP